MTDHDLSAGTIAFYSWGNESAIFDDVILTNPQNVIIFEEYFDGTDISGWTIVDEGASDAPSNWQVTDTQRLWQNFNIYSGDPTPAAASELPKPCPLPTNIYIHRYHWTIAV